jgi:hypothetical protein
VNTQGGYSGFSFPIGKRGIRYKVGGARGHSVEIGTKSRSKTQAYSRNEQARCLHGLSEDCGHAVLEVGESDGVSDGIVILVSNRANAPLFTIAGGTDVVAAVVNAAAQRA